MGNNNCPWFTFQIGNVLGIFHSYPYSGHYWSLLDDSTCYSYVEMSDGIKRMRVFKAARRA